MIPFFQRFCPPHFQKNSFLHGIRRVKAVQQCELHVACLEHLHCKQQLELNDLMVSMSTILSVSDRLRNTCAAVVQFNFYTTEIFLLISLGSRHVMTMVTHSDSKLQIIVALTVLFAFIAFASPSYLTSRTGTSLIKFSRSLSLAVTTPIVTNMSNSSF